MLTPQDIADGWCDNCGKRVPLSLVASSKSKAAPVTPVDVDLSDSQPAPRWAWAIPAVLLLGMVALLFLGRGG
jgi:hypothetical protein